MFEEIELTTILRVVPALQEKFDKHINNGEPTNIKILPTSDPKSGRLCQISLGSSVYRGILLDLPSHVEAYKTLDTQQYFKTNDVAQILLVVEDITDLDKYKDSTYLPDGITPPMTGAYDRLQKSISSLTACPAEDVTAIESLIFNKKGEEFVYDEVIEEEPHMKSFANNTTFLNKKNKHTSVYTCLKQTRQTKPT